MEIIDEFLAFGSLERQFAPLTVSAYRNDLNQLFAWLEGQKKKIETLDHEDLSEFLIQKRINGYQFSSIARNLFCLRVFFSWLNSTGLRKDNPSELLESPRLWSHLPDLLSPGEIEALVKSLSGKKRMVLRMKAILELLYGCGLRISELLGLKFENVDFEEKFVICFGKGSRERIIPFGDRVKKTLLHWIKTGRVQFEGHEKTPFLFIGQKKTCLTRQHVWLEIKRLAKKAGIDKNIHPHVFRHSYATHLLAGGGDLRVVQNLLGHADIMTTQKYTQVEKGELFRRFTRFHPRA